VTSAAISSAVPPLLRTHMPELSPHHSTVRITMQHEHWTACPLQTLILGSFQPAGAHPASCCAPCRKVPSTLRELVSLRRSSAPERIVKMPYASLLDCRPARTAVRGQARGRLEVRRGNGAPTAARGAAEGSDKGKMESDLGERSDVAVHGGGLREHARAHPGSGAARDADAGGLEGVVAVLESAAGLELRHHRARLHQLRQVLSQQSQLFEHGRAERPSQAVARGAAYFGARTRTSEKGRLA